MTSSQAPNKYHQVFSSAFFGALVAALSEASGSPWQIAASLASVPSPDESEPVRVSLMLSGSLQGDFLLEFHRAEAAMLVSKLLGQTVDEFETEHADALLKLIGAAVTNFCAVLEQQYGIFTVRAYSAFDAPSSGASRIPITASNGDDSDVSIVMHISPELTEALLPHSQTAFPAPEAREATKAALGEAIAEPVNLDLVMDVELGVTLRFGKRKLTLREVMELTSGSVVELDREVEEPVELLLNGMVIARGEAVVIDGNYGLRVTEVSQQVSPLVFN